MDDLYFLVFYPSDQTVEPHKKSDLTGENFHVGSHITAEFQTSGLSEAGLPIQEKVKYDGMVVFQSKIKKACTERIPLFRKAVTETKKSSNSSHDIEEHLTELGKKEVELLSHCGKRGASKKLTEVLDELKEQVPKKRKVGEQTKNGTSSDELEEQVPKKRKAGEQTKNSKKSSDKNSATTKTKPKELPKKKDHARKQTQPTKQKKQNVADMAMLAGFGSVMGDINLNNSAPATTPAAQNPTTATPTHISATPTHTSAAPTPTSAAPTTTHVAPAQASAPTLLAPVSRPSAPATTSAAPTTTHAAHTPTTVAPAQASAPTLPAPVSTPSAPATSAAPTATHAAHTPTYSAQAPAPTSLAALTKTHAAQIPTTVAPDQKYTTSAPPLAGPFPPASILASPAVAPSMAGLGTGVVPIAFGEPWSSQELIHDFAQENRSYFNLQSVQEKCEQLERDLQAAQIENYMLREELKVAGEFNNTMKAQMISLADLLKSSSCGPVPSTPQSISVPSPTQSANSASHVVSSPPSPHSTAPLPSSQPNATPLAQVATADASQEQPSCSSRDNRHTVMRELITSPDNPERFRCVKVDAAQLYNIEQRAQKKKPSEAPSFILNGLMKLLFTPEQLAAACGQGIKKKGVNARPPLDLVTIGAVKEYIRSISIKNKWPLMDQQAFNARVNQKCSNARRDMKPSTKAVAQ